MAYHPFERIVSLWLQRVKGFYVMENYPIRYEIEKSTKYSPKTATTDIDLVYYNYSEQKNINLVECKSNINETFHSKSRDRLLKQLEDEKELVKKLPFFKKGMKIEQNVYAIKIADRIKKKLPLEVKIVEGENFKTEVLDSLIQYIGKDCKIDPKDDVLSLIRLFWHFGILNESYYRELAKPILEKNMNISAANLRDELGLIKNQIGFCRKLIKSIKEKELKT